MPFRQLCRVLIAVALVATSSRVTARAAGGVIIGRVVDAGSGRAVPGAIVHVEGPGTNQSRVSDSRGQFFFVNLGAGSFEIAAQKAGYYEGRHGRLRAGGAGLPLELAANQWSPDVTIPMFRPAVIAGFVTDESNEPLVGVRVQALRREHVSGHWRLTTSAADVTDDQGQYRIGGLAPGDYVVTVPSVQVTLPVDLADAAESRDAGLIPAGFDDLAMLLSINGGFSRVGGRIYDADRRFILATGNAPTPPPRDASAFAYPSEYYPGVQVPSIAMPIPVASGERREGVNFQLRPVPTSRVSGVVVGPEGPIANQLLRLVHDEGPDLGLGTEVASTLTSASGAFRFLDVPAGRYLLSARNVGVISTEAPLVALIAGAAATGDPAGGSSVAARVRPLWASQPLSVSGEDLSEVILTMAPAQTIAGRVVAEPAAAGAGSVPMSDVRIAVDAVDGSRVGVAPVTPAPDGTFVVTGITNGAFVIRTPSLPAGWALKSATLLQRDASSVPFEVFGGVDPPEVVVTLTNRTSRFIGVVRDARSINASTATVLIFPTSFRSLSDAGTDPRAFRAVRASRDGFFTVTTLPTGEYYFVAVDESTTEGWQDVRRLERAASVATRVTARDDDNRTIDLRLVRVPR